MSVEIQDPRAKLHEWLIQDWLPNLDLGYLDNTNYPK